MAAIMATPVRRLCTTDEVWYGLMVLATQLDDGRGCTVLVHICCQSDDVAEVWRVFDVMLGLGLALTRLGTLLILDPRYLEEMGFALFHFLIVFENFIYICQGDPVVMYMSILYLIY